MSADIVVLDFETTSASVKDCRIVSYCMFRPGQEKRIGLLNPEMPIPPASTKIHGITDDSVKDAPTFRQISKSLLDYLGSAVLCGYNVRDFDAEVLRLEFERCGITYKVPGCIDPFVLWQQMEARTLENAFKRFCGKSLGDTAHDAASDAEAAWAISVVMQLEHFESFEAMQKLCDEPPPGFADRKRVIRIEDGRLILNIGKHRGMEVRHLEQSYVEWMLGQDFSDDVKKILRERDKTVFDEEA
jgi:DNA polymerase-3 subunit epsilon